MPRITVKATCIHHLKHPQSFPSWRLSCFSCYLLFLNYLWEKSVISLQGKECNEICGEPEWGTPPMAKVMRKEAQHTQRQDRASGVPLEILDHLPPKPESAYFTALCSHLHLWLYGGLSSTTISLLNRFFRPHVIVQSLPTVRGIRCSKLSTDSFEQLKDWLEIVLVKGFSLVGPMFVAKFPYPLPAVSLAVYWLI